MSTGYDCNCCYLQQKKSRVSEDRAQVEETDVENSSSHGVSEDVEVRNMLRSHNRKKKSGGFQSMGK